jgi:hypothetical protein
MFHYLHKESTSETLNSAMSLVTGINCNTWGLDIVVIATADLIDATM